MFVMKEKRIGIVGYGNLGKYLTREIMASDDMTLAFVWNRTQDAFDDFIQDRFVCRDLEDCGRFEADLVVEVAHPDVTEKYGRAIMKECDFMVGSPTAFADQSLAEAMREAASQHGVYVPSGALWGAHDIQKMADTNTLKELRVTMKKHPSCFKLESPLKERNSAVTDTPVTLYEGPVRALCPLAPNNVNTMAAAAVAAHNLGFDGVTGSLVSDPSLIDWHIVEIETTGRPGGVGGRTFTTTTVRRNPANPGVVTGSATYASFLSSVKRAGWRGPGVHIC